MRAWSLRQYWKNSSTPKGEKKKKKKKKNIPRPVPSEQSFKEVPGV